MRAFFNEIFNQPFKSEGGGAPPAGHITNAANELG